MSCMRTMQPDPAIHRDLAVVNVAVKLATDAMLRAQCPDGHWVFELEADATIPAEYVLLVHYLGETPDHEFERKIARYLRRTQRIEGGWPLFEGGAANVSASVKTYFALKMIGDEEGADHMKRARRAIRAIVVQIPRNADRLRSNPLGIYVNAISWSRELRQ